jgi:hypothetical protein
MASPTLDSKSLGNLHSITIEKNAQIQQIPMPLSNSDQTINFDMMGVLRTITLSGVWTGTTTAAVKSLVDAIEGIMDGDQAVIVFTSDSTGDINVMIESIVATWNFEGVAVVCTYTIRLLEGTAI